MKNLRVVHGLQSNVIDIEVPDNFDIVAWAKAVKADDMIATGNVIITRQWVQWAAVMSVEDAAKTLTQGMTKQ